MEAPPPQSYHAKDGPVEDYRLGYPRYTALISTYKPYMICRRFDRVRARLLLLKQDRLSTLEKCLEQADEQEGCALFLGKSRSDQNRRRQELLIDIEARMQDYDQFVERTVRLLGLKEAEARDVESLQNWLHGTGCLDREESAYLSHRDLVSLASIGDSAQSRLEAWVEGKFIQFWSGSQNKKHRRGQHLRASVDPNVYIYSGSLIQRTAKVFLLSMITLLLLAPVVICNMIGTFSGRIVVVTASTICYLLILAELTQARTTELTLAGATYATVLIVFVSGASGI